MYVIVNKSKLRDRYFGITNTLPDGRVYFPIGEIRNVGTLLNVDIIGSARELKELIERQIEDGITHPDVDPGFSKNPDSDNIDSDFGVNPLPDSGDGNDNTGTGENDEGESSQENGDTGQGDNGETEEIGKGETEQGGDDTLPPPEGTEEKEPKKARGGRK